MKSGRGAESGVDLVRMTWEWVVFEAYVKCFKYERYLDLWEGLENRLGGEQWKGACGSGKAEAVGVRKDGSVIFWFLKCGEGP